MNVLLNYNFNAEDIADGDFTRLFQTRRRDASFAFVYEQDGATYAIRDHLGIVPLYYRISEDGARWSTHLSELVRPGDRLNPDGVNAFLSLGTPRLMPLIEGIGIVPPGAVIKLMPNGRTETVYQYRIQPHPIPLATSSRALTDSAAALFKTAMERLVRHETVGLYLSGGIDSALIGIHLRDLGVEVNAYTSAPWGSGSSEIAYSKQNAATIGARRQSLDLLETERYPALYHALPELYGIPHATTTALGVASLWLNTPIAGEQQVFFGQNSDTMTCSVPAQYNTVLLNALPRALRSRLHRSQRYDDVVLNYLSFSQVIDPARYPALPLPYDPEALTPIQLITLAGMLLVHTPSDGEVLSQPAIRRNIRISNPYYDVDLVEFCLGIPLRHRLALSRESKLGLALEKHVFRQMALRYLPRDVVYRKKAFTVPFNRDERSRTFTRTLPEALGNRSLNNFNQRFAAGILQRWMEQQEIVPD